MKLTSLLFFRGLFFLPRGNVVEWLKLQLYIVKLNGSKMKLCHWFLQSDLTTILQNKQEKTFSSLFYGGEGWRLREITCPNKVKLSKRRVRTRKKNINITFFLAHHLNGEDEWIYKSGERLSVGKNIWFYNFWFLSTFKI